MGRLFDRPIKRFIAILIIIILVFIAIIVFGCAPIDSEGNHITSPSSKDDIIDYTIVFNGKVITGETEQITRYGDGSILIHDIDGTLYRTSWENILLIQD